MRQAQHRTCGTQRRAERLIAMGWRRTLVIAFMLAAVAGCGADDPISRNPGLQHSYSIRDPQFQRTLDHVIGPPSVGGNAIVTLHDAREIYPAMLEAIRAAQRSICFEIHTFWSGSVGDQFIEALCERAQAGVATHVIIDDAGSNHLDAGDFKKMEACGVRVVRYNPIEKVLFLFTVGDVNHRNHRKILVVDGNIGFTGGIGVADLWLGEKGERPWRDMMYRIEGPVVAQLQGAFMENWIETTKKPLHEGIYFPALQNEGDLQSQFVRATPQDGEATIELMFLLAIYASERSIDIATPYFVPNQLLIDALRDAARRGVRVRIIVPGPHTDEQIVRIASQSRWNDLLKAGVSIYEYQPAMYHCKVMVVDGYWTSVGSANLDPRSLRINDEANLNVFDEDFAAQQTRILEQDIAQCKQITEARHERRSLLNRVGEFVASLFSPQL